MTDTSHDEGVSYEDHDDLIAENAAATERLRLTEDELQSLKITVEVLRNDLCERSAGLAEAMSVCRRRDAQLKVHAETIESLNEELTDRDCTIAELREQVASRTIAIEERDRVVSEQRTLRANTYRTERDHYQKRAQQAEAERDTVKAKLHRVLTDLNGLKAANDEMGRKMEEDAARIASLEAEISTSEAEFSALKEAPDAVA